MNPTETLYLTGFNRHVITSLLVNSAPGLATLMERVTPYVDQASRLYPGQSALILRCESEEVADRLILNLTAIRNLLLGHIPFAELTVETVKERKVAA